MKKTAVILAAVAAIGVVAFLYLRDPGNVATPPESGAAIASVKVPVLAGDAVLGERAFNAVCMQCHGQNAAGVAGKGPPLVHKYYEPGHHGDMAFQMAAQRGVKSHHWTFGDMPPVEGITSAEVNTIIAYVRTLQRANGIN